MKKQSAVDYLYVRLVEIYSKCKRYDITENTMLQLWHEATDQAKAMEREQIQSDFIAGMEFIPVDPKHYESDAKEYFTETYEQ